MDALRKNAAVNWDSDESESGGEPSPAPAPAPHAASSAPTRGAAPEPRGPAGADSRTGSTTSSEGTGTSDEESDDDVSEMSLEAEAVPRGRGAQEDHPEQASTNSEDEEESGSESGSVPSPVPAPPASASAFTRRAAPPVAAPKARGSAPAGADGVDWDGVARQLAAVPQAYKQSQFDPVPHVVEILNAQEPDKELDKLQDQQVSVEGLVDDVVAGYSSGFSKAIQSYSRILQLFTDGSQLVQRSTRALEEAGTHLSSRKPALQAQWLRAATSAQVVRILDSVAHTVSFEERVAACLREGRPNDAVTALLEAASSLDREELKAIPGLRDVRAQVVARRLSLFDDLLAVLSRSIYAPDQPADAPASQQQGAAPHAQAHAMLNPLAAAAAAKRAAADGGGGGSGGGGGGPPDGGAEGLRLGLSQFRAAAAEAAARAGRDGGDGTDAAAAAAAASQVVPPRDPGASVDELVDALLRVSSAPGQGSAAGAVREALSQRHAAQLRSLIAAQLARCTPRNAPAAAAAAAAASSGHPSRAASSAAAVRAAVADSPAVDALEGVCAALQDALTLLLRAQRRVVESPAAWAEVKGPLQGKPPSQAYAEEAQRAWMTTQAELERLLAALLAPPPPPPSAPLRGAEAVAARRAAEDAVALAKAVAAAAAGAQAAAVATTYSFNLSGDLVSALVLAPPAEGPPGSNPSSRAASPMPGAAPMAPPVREEVAPYLSAAQALPGSGPALAPFATAPVLQLSDAIAAAFPECNGAASEPVAAAQPAAPPAGSSRRSRRGRT